METTGALVEAGKQAKQLVEEVALDCWSPLASQWNSWTCFGSGTRPGLRQKAISADCRRRAFNTWRLRP